MLREAARPGAAAADGRADRGAQGPGHSTPTSPCCRAPTASPPPPPPSARRWPTWSTGCAPARAGGRGAAAGQDQRRRGQLQRPPRRLSGVDWPAFARRFVESWGSPGTPTPPRSSPTTTWRSCSTPWPLQHRPDRLLPRRLGLHLARLLQAEDGRRRGRLLHHAAQGQPHRLRERRGQPGDRQRHPRAPGRASCRSRAGSAT
jgi:hypothetical protein